VPRSLPAVFRPLRPAGIPASLPLLAVHRLPNGGHGLQTGFRLGRTGLHGP
jgi:hypothetical protein